MNNYDMGVRRGEIHLVRNDRNAVGSEQKKDRPALIVSNNKNNEHSAVIEVVYMTTKPKTQLPTHVYLDTTSNGKCEGSTILCEQVYSISKKRLAENSYICRASDEDMEVVDEALMISLGLDDYLPGEDEQPEKCAKMVKIELIEEPEETEEIDEEYEEYEDDGELEETIEKLKTAEMERDFYKQQYESVMERIMAKANI